MKHLYTISVDGQHQFELSKQDLSELDVHRISENQLHVLYKGESYLLDLRKTDFLNKKYEIHRASTPHEVHLSDPLDALIASLGFSMDAKNNIQQITAPMPGLILDIHVKKGQEVQEDDSLLILEAMKMENVVSSPRSGTIKEIKVKKGAAVDKSQVLIEFENE